MKGVFQSILTLLLVAGIGACASQGRTGVERSGAMSTWLREQVAPSIADDLAHHPRYLGQTFRVIAPSGDALSQDIAVEIRAALRRHGVLAEQSGRALAVNELVSVDALDCRAAPKADYLVQVAVSAREIQGEHEVRISLREDAPQVADLQHLVWRGELSTSEAALFAKAATTVGNGSIGAPFALADVERVSASLVDEFVCSLRPHIVERLTLAVVADAPGGSALDEILRATHYQLSRYRELTLVTASDQADMRVRLEAVALSDRRYQLWLYAEPGEQAALHRISLVTHVSGRMRAEQRVSRAPVRSRPLHVAPPQEKPNRFLKVSLLDTTQQPAGRDRVALHVLLQIENTADWPIEYAFSLAGGYYEHCLAREDLFRHDGLGTLSGTIEAGVRETHRLVVSDVRHKPVSLYGASKCAGFRDLDAFRHFAESGSTVTDYLRWAS